MDYSTAVAWTWPYDEDFINGLDSKLVSEGITSYIISASNLDMTMELLIKGEISFATFFDRASDENPEFLPLAHHLHDTGVFIFNDHHLIQEAVNKETMHLRLKNAGIIVPYTVFIPPYNVMPDPSISLADLERLGDPLIVKPAVTTGGGKGVENVDTIEQILEARKNFPHDVYLLQRKVVPATFGERKAWFRSFYAFGSVITSWWDPETHIYEPLSREHAAEYHLKHTGTLMRKIQKICRLDFFSSEVAIDSRRHYYVIDYVNEVPDLRLQSKHGDGVPDIMIGQIQDLYVQEVRRYVRHIRLD